MSPTDAAVLNGSSTATTSTATTSDAAQAHELAAELTTARGLLRFATAGSVDDGKSTLVGRLLHDSKSVL